VRTAALETFGDLVAALLPCMWGFNATAKRLDARGRPDHEGYAAWVDMYAGEEFTELTDWCLDLMDEVAAGADDGTRERYRERFVTSGRYEYRFWDAAWREEEWEVVV
jgi:thiaminase/transcriptional activator TenA